MQCNKQTDNYMFYEQCVLCIPIVFLSIGEFILVYAMIRNGLKVSKLQSISEISFFNAEGSKKNIRHL